MTKLANRVGAVLEGAIASVVSKARKPKVPANPLVCLGPGGEFATAYVGERDGSLTATNPEEFVGLASTDRGSLRPANGSAPMCDTDMCDTESQRALLALAAIGAATAARLKAQMATVYRLVWLRCGNLTNRGLNAWLGLRWPEVRRRLDEGDAFVEVR